MKKYFTPPIEDIRIGYELEFHNSSIDELGDPRLNYDRWEPATLNKGNVLTLLEYGVKGTRVSYLTKEQIEAEGWNILKKSDNNYIYARKGKFSELRYDISHSTLAIYNTIEALNETIKLPAFYGECPSVNEFRTIIKLLNL